MAEEIRYDCRSYGVVYFSNTNQTTVHDEGQKTLKDNERAFIFVLQHRLKFRKKQDCTISASTSMK